jgi:cytochrome P450
MMSYADAVQGLTHALLYLALLPEYWKPLRDEVEEALSEEGWTKTALDRMSKVDSFIKESQRLHPAAICKSFLTCNPTRCSLSTSLVLLNRKVLDDFTFSDGAKIPAGTNLSVSVTNTHLNPDNYENPSEFDGFRFCKMKDKESGEAVKKFDMVATSSQFLTFGHGRHACPGRFFATAELKMMFAYILITYDLKVANGVRPPDVFLMHTCLPNPDAEILFRRRR